MAQQSARITIERLAAGGDGIGHLDGKVCFVPWSAPGDHLIIRITNEKKRYSRGEITEILTPGVGRVQPKCGLFGQCGGCQWQHIAASTQQEAKQAILSQALDRPELDFTPTGTPYAYRRQVRLHLNTGRSTSPKVGFIRAGSRRIVQVTECPIMAPQLQCALTTLHRTLCPTIGGPATIRLAAGDAGAVVAVDCAAAPRRAFYQHAEALVPKSLAGVVAIVDGHRTVVAGTGDVVLSGSDGQSLCTPVTSFGQANEEANHHLGRTVDRWLGDRHFSNALELFAGAGNLTGVLATRIKQVTAVEWDTSACRALKENLHHRQLRGVTIEAGDALEHYRQLHRRFELVVLDPPRTGQLELARLMATGPHRAVLYISCNPATLSRDIGVLRRGGFHLTEAIGFDMFPQTSHIEAAVLLER